MIFLGVLEDGSNWPDVVSAIASIVSVVVAFVSFKVANSAKYISRMQLRVSLFSDRAKVFRAVLDFNDWVRHKNLFLSFDKDSPDDFLISIDDARLLDEIRIEVFHLSFVFGMDLGGRVNDWMEESIRGLKRRSRKAGYVAQSEAGSSADQIDYVEFRIECERHSEILLGEMKKMLVVEEVDSAENQLSKCKKFIIQVMKK
ncbi:hypothetical protein ACFOLG_09720 [Vogesella facilis]|uniref:Uncharacterized protein n=1 Tax=Vogesella facilis TaxID=1655232 RepID=A0ABV7RDR1_9NEIS